jgi:hypothetical protein
VETTDLGDMVAALEGLGASVMVQPLGLGADAAMLAVQMPVVAPPFVEQSEPDVMPPYMKLYDPGDAAGVPGGMPNNAYNDDGEDRPNIARLLASDTGEDRPVLPQSSRFSRPVEYCSCPTCRTRNN